jgi:hypothetical protein
MVFINQFQNYSDKQKLIYLLTNADKDIVIRFFENEIIIPILRALDYPTIIPKSHKHYISLYDSYYNYDSVNEYNTNYNSYYNGDSLQHNKFFNKRNLLRAITYYIELNINLTIPKLRQYKKKIDQKVSEYMSTGHFSYEDTNFPLFIIFYAIIRIRIIQLNGELLF